MTEVTAVIAAVLFAVTAGVFIGLFFGEVRQRKLLINLITYGKPTGKDAGRTIVPETAEVRLDRDAAMVEQEYTKATIATGVAHLEALYTSEGAEVPSKKDLEEEVKDMLGRSGTPEAGVHV